MSSPRDVVIRDLRPADQAAAIDLETIRWHDPAKPSLERFYARLGYIVSDVLPMSDEWSVLTMLRPPATGFAGGAI